MIGSRTLFGITGLTAILALSTGCDDESTPFGSAATFDGLVFQTALLQTGEVLVGGEVTIENRSSSPRTLLFPDSCPALLRAYSPVTGERVWDQRDAKTGCRERETEVRFEPGEVREFGVNGTSVAILGFTLPDGDYRIVAYLQPIGEPEIELSLGTITLARPDR